MYLAHALENPKNRSSAIKATAIAKATVAHRLNHLRVPRAQYLRENGQDTRNGYHDDRSDAKSLSPPFFRASGY